MLSLLSAFVALCTPPRWLLPLLPALAKHPKSKSACRPFARVGPVGAGALQSKGRHDHTGGDNDLGAGPPLRSPILRCRSCAVFRLPVVGTAARRVRGPPVASWGWKRQQQRPPWGPSALVLASAQTFGRRNQAAVADCFESECVSSVHLAAVGGAHVHQPCSAGRPPEQGVRREARVACGHSHGAPLRDAVQQQQRMMRPLSGRRSFFAFCQ